MGKASQRTWPAHRTAEHTHEHDHPEQKKRVNPGDDNWGLKVTSLPVTDPKVSSSPGDEIAQAAVGNYMRPIYSDHESAYIQESHTDGKRKG